MADNVWCVMSKYGYFACDNSLRLTHFSELLF